ncbi:C-C motif chemokine 26-like [Brachyistius frenatus]|uniref:C-C motif chemokine 26-like n=1 Tax=Brachyistius frenatus TaxID=100188 RepID=UPI0037E6FE25
MKTLATLGLLTFICFLRQTSTSPQALSMMLMEGCCTGYNRTMIPHSKVKHVAMTPSGCKPAAVIVTVKSGKKFCLDPKWQRAETLLAKYEKSQGASRKL